MATKTPPEAVTGISIGALSRATGVPVATLRTWERRYGFPVPARRTSGHRRYPADAIGRVRLVRTAVQLGMRAADAVPAELATLRQWLSAHSAGAADGAPEFVEPSDRPRASATAILEKTGEWIELVRALNGVALDHELRRACQGLGAESFVLDCAVPLLSEVGERWARQDLGVGHEHFASERVREVLTSIWRPLSDAASGDLVVLAGLSGEEHCLGLHMAAVLLALRGRRIVFLGADTPPTEIARTTKQCGATTILIGSSPSADPARFTEQVTELKGAFRSRLNVLVGGTPQDPLLRGVHWLPSLRALAAWADEEERTDP